MRTSRKWLVCLLAFGLWACERDVSSTTPANTEIGLRTAVTPEVASSLSASGELPNQVVPENENEITPAYAVELARAYVRTAGPSVFPPFERFHGNKIDINVLRPGEPLYTASPYADLPDNVPMSKKRMYGPWFQVPFVRPDGSVAVIIAVSAYNKDVQIRDGRLVLPRSTGHNFFPTAPRHGTNVFVTPERAAIAIHQKVHARVASVPKPIIPGGRYAPTNVYWEVLLERPVRAVVNGQARLTERIILTNMGEPAISQPAGHRSRTVRYLELPTTRSGPRAERTFNLVLRPGTTDQFVEATIEQER